MKPHRGTLIVILGILSLVICAPVLSVCSALAQTFSQPSSQAQNPINFNGSNPYSSQTKVYRTQNGFQNLTPSTVIQTYPPIR